MPQNAPVVRADREWGNQIELYATEQILIRLAKMIDAATLTGSIYTRLILPPDLAQRKLQASQQGGQ